MVENEDFLEKPIEINLKKLKLKKIVKKHKLAIIFGLAGLILIVSGAGLLFYFNKKEQPVTIIPVEDQVGINDTKNKKEIVIDVSGAVFKPGVYKLKDGDRLQEALIAAGGLSDSADRDWVEKNINLAVRLVDGNKVYIPKVGEMKDTEVGSGKLPARQASPGEAGGETGTGVDNAGAGQVAGVQNALININTASMAELDTLPGVGEKTAQKIIAGRPYTTIDDLVNKKIIYKSVFDKIKDKISVY